MCKSQRKKIGKSLPLRYSLRMSREKTTVISLSLLNMQIPYKSILVFYCHSKTEESAPLSGFREI